VARRVDLGIAQIGHGKRAGIARTQPGDWLVELTEHDFQTIRAAIGV
jgi:hypothetical protein